MSRKYEAKDEETLDLPKELLEHEHYEHDVFRPESNLTNHRWRQRGNAVECDQCDLHHGFYIQTNQILTGIDTKGYPVISTR
jgi:hypothetical protein